MVQKMLPDGPDWLCYLAGTSKRHRRNSSFFFAILSSSRHENRYLMLERLFQVFPGSINLLCSFSEHAFETQKSRLAQENREKLVLEKNWWLNIECIITT